MKSVNILWRSHLSSYLPQSTWTVFFLASAHFSYIRWLYSFVNLAGIFVIFQVVSVCVCCYHCHCYMDVLFILVICQDIMISYF